MKRRLSLICAFFIAAQFASAEPSPLPAHNIATVNHAIKPGERLFYTISWSGILTAGTAEMEVAGEKTAEGRQVFRLVSKARSAWLISAFYPVSDTIQSVMDAEGLYSLSYSLDENHAGKKRTRLQVFDQETRTVKLVSNGVPQGTADIPYHAQDALSALYYLRTRDDFKPGSPIIIDVHDGGQNWSVAVLTLGRETLKTSLGTFKTIKVVTYPKYEGVFQNKGEIMIWLTDDANKVPVLMKSKISIGSIMATLSEMKVGDDKR